MWSFKIGFIDTEFVSRLYVFFLAFSIQRDRKKNFGVVVVFKRNKKWPILSLEFFQSICGIPERRISDNNNNIVIRVRASGGL